ASTYRAQARETRRRWLPSRTEPALPGPWTSAATRRRRRVHFRQVLDVTQDAVVDGVNQRCNPENLPATQVCRTHSRASNGRSNHKSSKPTPIAKEQPDVPIA